MRIRTLESNRSIGILVRGIFVRLWITFTIVKLISVLVIPARVALEYVPSIASMLDFLTQSISASRSLFGRCGMPDARVCRHLAPA